MKFKFLPLQPISSTNIMIMKDFYNKLNSSLGTIKTPSGTSKCFLLKNGFILAPLHSVLDFSKFKLFLNELNLKSPQEKKEILSKSKTLKKLLYNKTDISIKLTINKVIHKINISNADSEDIKKLIQDYSLQSDADFIKLKISKADFECLLAAFDELNIKNPGFNFNHRPSITPNSAKVCRLNDIESSPILTVHMLDENTVTATSPTIKAEPGLSGDAFILYEDILNQNLNISYVLSAKDKQHNTARLVKAPALLSSIEKTLIKNIDKEQTEALLKLNQYPTLEWTTFETSFTNIIKFCEKGIIPETISEEIKFPTQLTKDKYQTFLQNLRELKDKLALKEIKNKSEQKSKNLKEQNNLSHNNKKKIKTQEKADTKNPPEEKPLHAIAIQLKQSKNPTQILPEILLNPSTGKSNGYLVGYRNINPRKNKSDYIGFENIEYPSKDKKNEFTFNEVLTILEKFKKTPKLDQDHLYPIAFLISEAMRFEIVEDMIKLMIDNPSLEINWNDWHPLLTSYSDILKDKYSANYAKEPCLIKNEHIQTFIKKNPESKITKDKDKDEFNELILNELKGKKYRKKLKKLIFKKSSSC
jgi:hypothetical protein